MERMRTTWNLRLLAVSRGDASPSQQRGHAKMDGLENRKVRRRASRREFSHGPRPEDSRPSGGARERHLDYQLELRLFTTSGTCRQTNTEEREKKEKGQTGKTHNVNRMFDIKGQKTL
ncbi:hypothetical protein PoB_001352400 [Plakobranchus ocellatus]|uniref:Uncharacterized protein n=1 Tax=Plakobranchus ocellatus TaxID=259542 RepID=A0AAV3YY26_9GAST|nr:hypothetical protein PoB_001352400 [Plakobranchus ocellatus]